MQQSVGNTPTGSPRHTLARQWCIGLSILAGLITDVASLVQLTSGDAVATLFGLWNLAASLAYYYLAYSLGKQETTGVSFGLKLTWGNLIAELGWMALVININHWSDPNAQAPGWFVAGMVVFIGSDVVLGSALLVLNRLQNPVVPPSVTAEDVAVVRSALRQQRKDAASETEIAIPSTVEGESLLPISDAMSAAQADLPMPESASATQADPAVLFLQSRTSLVTELSRVTLDDLFNKGQFQWIADVEHCGIHFDVALIFNPKAARKDIRAAILFVPNVSSTILHQLADNLRFPKLTLLRFHSHVLVVGVTVEQNTLRRFEGDKGRGAPIIDVVDLRRRLTTAPRPSLAKGRYSVTVFEKHLQRVYGVTLEHVER